MEEQIPESTEKNNKKIKSVPKPKGRDKTRKERGLLTLELAEIKEISDKIFERIDKKIEVLKALEASVDEKIAALRKLGQDEEALGKTSGHFNRQTEVLLLEQRGMNIDEIASILSMPKGEVELILNLNKDRETVFDYPPKTQKEQKNYFKETLRNKTHHSFISLKLLWIIPFLVGIVVLYIFLFQRSDPPFISQNIEQNPIVQQQQSPEQEKSRAIDLIRQKYNVPQDSQSHKQLSTLEEKKSPQEGTSGIKEVEQKEQKKTIKVITDVAIIRSNPSLKSKPITRVYKGIVLEIKEESTDDTGKKWYKIITADGKGGWISDTVVSKPS
jgi:hypothetical protein